MALRTFSALLSITHFVLRLRSGNIFFFANTAWRTVILSGRKNIRKSGWFFVLSYTCTSNLVKFGIFAIWQPLFPQYIHLSTFFIFWLMSDKKFFSWRKRRVREFFVWWAQCFFCPPSKSHFYDTLFVSQSVTRTELCVDMCCPVLFIRLRKRLTSMAWAFLHTNITLIFDSKLNLVFIFFFVRIVGQAKKRKETVRYSAFKLFI